jgi:hypothetical protein
MKSPEGFLEPACGSYHKSVSRVGSSGAEEFRKEVCEVYDLLIGNGMERNLAIRRTRAILKATNYPFVTYDTVMTRLRASGRFKKNGRGKMRTSG